MADDEKTPPAPLGPPGPARVVAEKPDADDGKQSPKKWFRALTPKSESKRDNANRLALHDAASTLHGWAVHRHHEGGKAIQLTRDDYVKALEGTGSGKGRAGRHKPACSPHLGKGL